jgi:hypothetical protein
MAPETGDPMKLITLEKMDGQPVTFVGELAAQSEAPIADTGGLKRSFTLKLYLIESGGFVPTVEYFSEATTEKTGCLAEIVDLYKDIENFFFVFMPGDLLLDSNMMDRDQAEARRRLSNKLEKVYQAQAFAFLDELSEQFVAAKETSTSELGELESGRN